MMNLFEHELDAIRINLYEETKDMSAQERLDYLRKLSEPVRRELEAAPAVAPEARPLPTKSSGTAL